MNGVQLAWTIFNSLSACKVWAPNSLMSPRNPNQYEKFLKPKFWRNNIPSNFLSPLWRRRSPSWRWFVDEISQLSYEWWNNPIRKFLLLQKTYKMALFYNTKLSSIMKENMERQEKHCIFSKYQSMKKSSTWENFKNFH